ncbi:NAD-dependent epimerase/dehydratase family protein [Kutzneria kofuensis]|nr:NAD-dependent epimerase/dehydratase family protein [Kutzneria kofuensis]
MRVLVTGAAGFVGRAVVRRLCRAGHDVVALVHRTTAEFPAECQVRTADLHDLDDVVADVDGVCHLAGATRVRDSFAAPVEYFHTNVTGTLALLAALDRVRPAARLVFASTAAVYGSSAVQPISEAAAPNPQSPYAASKHAAEAAVHWQSATGRLGAITLRAFNIAGPGDTDLTRLIPKLIAVSAGQAPFLEINGDGAAVRDFLHVDDFAAAIDAALAACRLGEHRIYNVSGTRASIADVVRTARAVTGVDIEVRHRPPQPEPSIVVGDSARIRSELGWRPWSSTLTRIIADAWEAHVPLATMGAPR